MKNNLLYEIGKLLGYSDIMANKPFKEDIIVMALRRYRDDIIENQQEIKDIQKFREDLIKEHQEKI